MRPSLFSAVDPPHADPPQSPPPLSYAFLHVLQVPWMIRQKLRQVWGGGRTSFEKRNASSCGDAGFTSLAPMSLARPPSLVKVIGAKFLGGGGRCFSEHHQPHITLQPRLKNGTNPFLCHDQSFGAKFSPMPDGSMNRGRCTDRLRGDTCSRVLSVGT